MLILEQLTLQSGVHRSQSESRFLAGQSCLARVSQACRTDPVAESQRSRDYSKCALRYERNVAAVRYWAIYFLALLLISCCVPQSKLHRPD